MAFSTSHKQDSHFIKRPVSSVVKRVVIGARDLRFDSTLTLFFVAKMKKKQHNDKIKIPGPVKSSNVANDSCVAQALSCGDGPRHSLHASVQYRGYNEGLIFYFSDLDSRGYLAAGPVAAIVVVCVAVFIALLAALIVV